jgi:putative MATE family efflux protein
MYPFSMNIKKYFSTFLRALKGEHHDYTTGAIAEAVMLLAIPMILELSLESVFAVVDMFFVSKLGAGAIATVGLTESVVTILYSVGIGLSTGAAAVVARRVGEKDLEGAAHAGAQAMVLATVVSLVLGILGAVFAGDILRIMGAAPDVIAEGTIFARIMLGGSLVIVMLFLINGIFRGAGDAAMAMKSLWISSGLNIILCPVFIHLFGLKGAAIATVLSRASGCLYQCSHLKKGDGILKFKKEHFHFDSKIIRSVTQIAWPASLQFLIGSGSWIILTRLVAEVGGTAASAGYQIASRNFVFFILPAFGLSNAAATLVGQNLGAKRLDRAEESVIVTAKFSAFFMFFVSIFFLLFSGPVVSVFTQDPVVFNHGKTALQILGSGFVFYGVGMVFTQAFNGAGDTKIPTVLNFVCFWLFQTPFAYFLAMGLNLGADGVMYSIPVAQGVLAVAAWIFFKKGNWKKVKI